MINWQRGGKFTWRTYTALVLLFVILFFVLALMILEGRLTPVLEAWAQTRAVSLATAAISAAVEEVMTDSLSSTSLAHLIRDGEGSLQGIQYNMGEINRVSSQAAQRILENLEQLGQQVFPIPLGQLSGLAFLATRGPGIPVRIIPVGALRATPVASFASAGINQTWHRVFLDVQVTMRVAVPLVEEELVVSMQIPMVEEVFMGTVPSWYFAGQENLRLHDGKLEFPLN